MRTKVTIGCVVFGLVLHSTPAQAEPNTHDGFQFRGAIGPAFLSDTETAADGSGSATISGGAASLELYFGGTPARGLVVGGFVMGTSAASPSVSANGQTVGTASGASLGLGNFGPYIDYYPNPRGGFHVIGTLAFANLNVSNGNGTQQNVASGGAIGAGAGYDFWVADEWSLGVLARLTYAGLKDSNSDSESTVAAALLFSVTYQ